MIPAERATSRISGAESPLRADVRAPGSSARSVGLRSPVIITSKRSPRTISTRWRAPRALVSRPRSGLRARLRTRLARSPVGLPEMPLHSRAGAQLGEHAAHRGERRALQRVGPGRQHDGVEDQAGDARRIARGVVERDLRPVGDAEEDELLVAAVGAQGLDVLDARGRRVRAAAGADLAAQRWPAAVSDPLIVQFSRAGAAGAALVEHQQVARAEAGRQERLRSPRSAAAPPARGRPPGRRPRCWSGWRRRRGARRPAAPRPGARRCGPAGRRASRTAAASPRCTGRRRSRRSRTARERGEGLRQRAEPAVPIGASVRNRSSAIPSRTPVPTQESSPPCPNIASQ